MANLIGTAGHVDHGKTSLIRALTGIDTDRLPEEQSRAMTIDLGFAYLELPNIGKVSIVDVPGHAKFIHNMLVGALAIDVALLCVAADEAIKPQTIEHFEIIKLLPVNHMVVALTRCDLADADTREISRSDVVSLLEKSRFRGSPIIETSAETGQGLEELKAALADAISKAEPPMHGQWYLPIDRAFVVKGHGVVVTGTLAQGTVREGESVTIEPGKLTARIRSIQWHDEKQTSSERGRRTALNLTGVKLEQIQRGMCIGTPGVLSETTLFDAKVDWVTEPKHGARVRVSIGADEVIGKMFLNEADSSLVQFRLERATAAAKDQPIIVRRYSPPDLVCGGKVMTPVAILRRRGENVVAIDEHLSEESEQVADFVSKYPNGVSTEEVCRAFAKTLQQLGTQFEDLKKSGKLYGFAGVWVSASSLEALRQRIELSLRKLHEENPTRSGIPRERVAIQAEIGLTGKPLDRLIAQLAEIDAVVVIGNDLRLPEFKVQLNTRQRELLDRVLRVLDVSGMNPPNEETIAKEIHVPIQAVTEILQVGQHAAEIVRVDDGIFFSMNQIAQIKNTVAELAREKPFTAAEFRDTVGTTRKFAIPLLEYLDATRFTLRQGDVRVLN